MANSKEISRMASERANNYRRALQHLNGLREFTYHGFVEVIRIAGIDMPESEIRQTWEMSKMTIPGTEGLRQTYRETLEQGIKVFDEVGRELR